MAHTINSYTSCIISVHLKQDFILSLTPPLAEDVDRVKNNFSFKKAEIDEENDFVSAGGVWSETKVIKSLSIVTSKNAAQVKILGGTTDDCFDIIYETMEVLYGKKQGDVDSGIRYVDYETTTKVVLDKPLYSVYSQEVQKLIKSWKELSDGSMIGVIKEGESWKDHSKSAIDICEEDFKRLYEGQSSALIMPSVVQFTISVPTNFHRLSHHKVSIAVESVEDFQENTYFIQTEFPYKSHLNIIDLIAGHEANKKL
ncbi:MAG: hypothetical protein COC19_02955 [SAR86 cluster bacterium]|uniref:Uncharacterized protein n=1 Tax=SAR86 cluster bacterium TaxID=2030880 RepID=A0A2A4MR61_9GAMM|nr:MAG: hypothetical protein COC19_02955 [SAR86 cluster bacterium]